MRFETSDLLHRGSGVWRVVDQSWHQHLTSATTPFFGASHTAIIPSIWTAWPHLDNPIPMTESPSVLFMFIIQVRSFSSPPCIALTNETLAATRIRRRHRELPFDHRPISRFEDAERIKTWPCPADGCGQTQFSFHFNDVWYSNVHGMTMDGHFIRGPTCL